MFGVYFIKKLFNGKICTLNENILYQKTIIVLGGTSGLGLEITKALLKKGANVLLVCRKTRKAQKLIFQKIKQKYFPNVYFIPCDLNHFDSIDYFMDVFKMRFEKFDILVNCSQNIHDVFDLDKNDFEMNLSTNYIGPMYFMFNIFKQIQPQGRIINLYSKDFVKYKFDIEEKSNDYFFKKLKTDFDYEKQFCFSKQCFYMFMRFLISKRMEKFIEKQLDFKIVYVDPGLVCHDSKFKFNGFFNKFYDVFKRLFCYLFGKDNFYGIQTILHVIFENYHKLENKGFYKGCSLDKIPNFLKDDAYFLEILNYTYNLFEKRFFCRRNLKKFEELLKIFDLNNR